jgi:hypothetical protein
MNLAVRRKVFGRGPSLEDLLAAEPMVYVHRVQFVMAAVQPLIQRVPRLLYKRINHKKYAKPCDF